MQKHMLVGTKVFCYNFEASKIELKSVINTFTNYAEKYVRIATNNGDVVNATGRHLFWNEEHNKWTMANLLEEGVVLKSLNEQNTTKVNSIQVIKETKKVYSLEVADNPNYFVGKNGFMVHNESKISIFASSELIEIEIYELFDDFDVNKESKYIGQTIQGFKKRYEQHLIEKKFKRTEILPKLLKKGIMTPFEAHVSELFELNTRGGKKSRNMWNKRNPISKNKFEIYKKLEFNNPCKFY